MACHEKRGSQPSALSAAALTLQQRRRKRIERDDLDAETRVAGNTKDKLPDDIASSAPGEFRHPDPLIKSQLLCL